jgi:DNA/RNA-binding domain of Phe-tRNA-synthetase-like protein
MIEVTSTWKQEYPGEVVGLLAMSGVENPQRHPLLDQEKEELENALRSRFASDDRNSLRTVPVLVAYDAYYRKFGKTYHVRHQLESLLFKDTSIPRVASLVEAMFMAELKNLLLTAGHDLDAIEAPLRISVATGNESYIRMNGEEQAVKAGDMMIADEIDVISCIIYGPDRRTRIGPETERAVFTVYGPPGITEQDVHRHLGDIRENVMLIAPGASVDAMQVIGTN